MSSTDKAFIKAYNDATKYQKPVDNSATQSQSFVVGPRHFRVSQFETEQVKAPKLDDTAAGRIESPSSQSQHLNLTREHDNRPDSMLNVRLDEAADSVVPAPHFSVKSAANKRSETQTETKPQSAGELELIELRLDLPESGVVPAPHFAVRANQAATQPEAKLSPQAESRKATDQKSVRPLTMATSNSTVNMTANSGATSQLRPNQVPSPAPLPVRETPALNAFVPAWEVDTFQWPAVCSQLDSLRSQSISEFVRAVLADAWQGTRVVAITEFGRGEGATTLSLCLAKWAAMFTGRVAIVDGDIMQPRIADSLGIAVGQGWEETSHEAPVSEAAIASVEDRLVALPLGGKSGLLAADADRTLGAHTLRELAGSFELVVLDAGPMFDAAYHWFAEPSVSAIDSVFVVQDVRSTSVEQVSDVRRRLIDQGMKRVSIVENFRTN